jgi:hypothetical protein
MKKPELFCTSMNSDYLQSAHVFAHHTISIDEVEKRFGHVQCFVVFFQKQTEDQLELVFEYERPET